MPRARSRRATSSVMTSPDGARREDVGLDARIRAFGAGRATAVQTARPSPRRSPRSVDVAPPPPRADARAPGRRRRRPGRARARLRDRGCRRRAATPRGSPPTPRSRCARSSAPPARPRRARMRVRDFTSAELVRGRAVVARGDVAAAERLDQLAERRERRFGVASPRRAARPLLPPPRLDLGERVLVRHRARQSQHVERTVLRRRSTHASGYLRRRGRDACSSSARKAVRPSAGRRRT